MPQTKCWRETKMSHTEWGFLDSLENAKNFLKFYYSFHCNFYWVIVRSEAWWRCTIILVLKLTWIVIFLLLVLHEWRNGVIFAYNHAVKACMWFSQWRCCLASFFSPLIQVNLKRSIQSYLTLLQYFFSHSWLLPFSFGFLTCQCCTPVCIWEAVNSL